MAWKRVLPANSGRHQYHRRPWRHLFLEFRLERVGHLSPQSRMAYMNTRLRIHSWLSGTRSIWFAMILPSVLNAQQPDPDAPTPPGAASTNRTTVNAQHRQNTNDPIMRIRDEGLNRSQVMETLSYLTDVIGPRLTGSPNLKRANEWTCDKLGSWGLTNAHLEPWGPFGRGWSLKRFSAQVIEPQTIPVAGYPNAWS